MTLQKSRLAAYLDAFDSIEGMFSPDAAVMFLAYNQLIAAEGIAGDTLEIGVHHGLSAVTVAWRMEHGGADPMALWERTNVNGGAIALGHPLGASGARLLTTLVWELERTGGRCGLQTMCEGGGMANALIIERV